MMPCCIGSLQHCLSILWLHCYHFACLGFLGWGIWVTSWTKHAVTWTCTLSVLFCFMLSSLLPFVPCCLWAVLWRLSCLLLGLTIHTSFSCFPAPSSFHLMTRSCIASCFFSSYCCVAYVFHIDVSLMTYCRDDVLSFQVSSLFSLILYNVLVMTSLWHATHSLPCLLN